MQKNISKICRICLCDGSRNIFEKKSSTDSTQQFNSIPSITQNVSSLDRLLEKLRYVTMLKIDENENLPKYLCDSCIVQLNVAYSFKRNAVESDIKIRQYIIEYGMNIDRNQCSVMANDNRPNGNSNNMLLPANNFLSPSSPVNDQTDHINAPAERRSFPVVPMIIKEEPIDFETLSDITIETNTDAFNLDERVNGHSTNLSRAPAVSTPTTTSRTNGNANHNNNRQRIPVNGSMVTLNDKSLLIATSIADIDYISPYLPTPSASEHSPVESTASTSLVQIVPQAAPVITTVSESGSSDTASKKSNASSKRGRSLNVIRARRNANETKTTASTPSTPITASTSNTNTDDPDRKPNTRSLQRQMHLLEINMLTDQRANNVQFDQRGSRTKGGVLEKKNYKTFFKQQPNPLNQEAREEIQKKMLSRSMSAGNGARKRNSLIKNGDRPIKRITSVLNGNRTIKRLAPLSNGSEPPLKRFVSLRSLEPRGSSMQLSVRKDLMTHTMGGRTRSNLDRKSELIGKTVPTLLTTTTTTPKVTKS